MNGFLPYPKYEYDKEWRWPWWKFELPPDALFTTLHERFNTRSPPIQDPQAFLLDVRECAQEADDVDGFYAKLAERRDQRVLELERAWDNVCSLMDRELWEAVTGCLHCKSEEAVDDRNPRDSKNDTEMDRQGAFCLLSRHMSFDRLIYFFDGFVRERRKIEDEKRRKSKAALQNWRNKWKLGFGRASVGGRDLAVPGDPSASAAAVPAPNSPDTSVSPEPAPSDETDLAGGSPASPNSLNFSTPKLPISPHSSLGDKTSAIQNHSAQDIEHTISPNVQAEPVKMRPSLSSASLSPSCGSSATQNSTAGEDQQQPVSNWPGVRKRSRGSSGSGRDENGDTKSERVPARKKRRMSHPNSYDHSANPALKQTAIRQTSPSSLAPTTARWPPDPSKKT